MASWDSGKDARPKKAGLRCLACGCRLERPLAVVGSLRCQDCRAANAVLNQRLVADAEGSQRAGVTSQSLR